MNSRILKIIRAQIHILGFCLLIVFLVFAFAGNARSKANFIVIPAADNFADSSYYYLNFYQEKLAKLLGSPLDTTVTLYIAHSNDEFNRMAEVNLPDWGAGVAQAERSRIVIKSPEAMPIGKSFQELIGHELTHIMLSRAVHGRWIPRWIHEGLAMYVSGEWNFGQDVLVARAAWTDNLIQLTALEELTSFKGPLASLSYTESYLAIKRLLKPKDQYVISDLLQMYRQTGDFYSSWRSIVGQDYISWITTWLADTSRQYHFFIFIFDNEIFWIILTLIFILLFVLKKRQNARVRRRWEVEEKLHPPDDSYRQYYDGYYDDEEGKV